MMEKEKNAKKQMRSQPTNLHTKQIEIVFCHLARRKRKKWIHVVRQHAEKLAPTQDPAWGGAWP